MKAKLGSWRVLPLLALSSLSFAEEPILPTVMEPVRLSVSQMDNITAGASTVIVNGGVMNIDTIGGNVIEFPAEAIKVIGPDTVRVTLADGETTISGSAVKVLSRDGTNMTPGDLVQLKAGESIRLTPGSPILLYIDKATQPINMDAVRLFFSNVRLKL